ncbi:hypothetical protein [Nocardioides terrisoli]|uniref:hypothetical protein n=1 Tax=Nocardioides terrisoli TaxID=3388267 RepID=UPI00287BAF92|nr:hypothetical protein [Nocardioides marmorisolisilvae]
MHARNVAGDAARFPAAVVALFALVSVLAAGCAASAHDQIEPHVVERTTVMRAAATLPVLPHGRSSYRHDRMVSVEGGRIHLGRRVISVAPLRADEAVATRGGTFFLNDGELWFTAAGRARSTGFEHVTHVVASPDGVFLGFVDRNHGPRLSGDDPVAAVVVVDTRTGKVLLRSYAGMGTADGRVRERYAQTTPTALSFRGDALLARTSSGRWRYPLDGSRPSPTG